MTYLFDLTTGPLEEEMITPFQLSREQLREWPFGITLEPSARPWGAHAREPSVGGWYAIPPDEIERQCQLLQQLGAFYVRIEFVWAYIEPEEKGKFDWERTDLIVETSGKYGLMLMPQVVWTPEWAGNVLNGPPRDATAYADFLSELVSRYGKRIKHWEMWNEANLGSYWAGSVEEYVERILIPGYRAVKQADPGAIVLLAGISGPDRDWLSRIYALGGKPHFDVAGVHQYSGRPDKIISAVQEIRKFMDENDDAAKPLWCTEFGYMTNAGAGAFFTEILQSYIVNEVYRKLVPTYAEKVFFYELKDNYDIDIIDDKRVESHEPFGLLKEDYALKRSFPTYRRIVLDYLRQNIEME